MDCLHLHLGLIAYVSKVTFLILAKTRKDLLLLAHLLVLGFNEGDNLFLDVLVPGENFLQEIVKDLHRSLCLSKAVN